MSVLDLSTPGPSTSDHRLVDFDCGDMSLNDWLKKSALKNHRAGESRCFVVSTGKDVVAYYCLSAGGISHQASPKAMRRNMHNPLSVLLVGRLAVDKRYHN